MRVETVECAECGNRYDSQANPFCPRCGSTKTGAALPGALAAGSRIDPRRRRVQVAGVALMVIGLFALAGSLYGIVDPQPLPASLYEGMAPFFAKNAQPGGPVHLHVLPAKQGNATGPLTATIAPYLEPSNRTAVAIDPSGQASFTPRYAYSNLTLTQGNQTWFIHFATKADRTLEADFDANQTAPGTITWFAWNDVRDARIAAAVGSAFCAFVVWGGVCALRLRGYGWALAATLSILIPFVLFTLLFPNLVAVLYVLLVGASLVLIIRGKRYFKRRK